MAVPLQGISGERGVPGRDGPSGQVGPPVSELVRGNELYKSRTLKHYIY